MQNKIYPTFSTKGWIDSPAEKLDYCLSHFFLAEKHQSYLQQDVVTDIQWIIASNKDNINQMCIELGYRIKDYLAKVFDQAEVSCYAKNYNNKESEYTIVIQIGIIDNNVPFDSQKLVNFKFGKLTKIANINNIGDPEWT